MQQTKKLKLGLSRVTVHQLTQVKGGLANTDGCGGTGGGDDTSACWSYQYTACVSRCIDDQCGSPSRKATDGAYVC